MSFVDYNRRAAQQQLPAEQQPGLQDFKSVAENARPGDVITVDEAGTVGNRPGFFGKHWRHTSSGPNSRDTAALKRAVDSFKEAAKREFPSHNVASALKASKIEETISVEQLKAVNAKLEMEGGKSKKELQKAFLDTSHSLAPIDDKSLAKILKDTDCIKFLQTQESDRELSDFAKKHLSVSSKYENHQRATKNPEFLGRLKDFVIAELKKPFFELVLAGVPKETQTALAKAHRVGGLCCSFAMDWAKSRLAGEPLTENTYTGERLGSIARIQGRYAQAAVNQAARAAELFAAGQDPSILDDPLIVAAGYYGLTMQGAASWKLTPDWEGEKVETGELQQGVYYVEVLRKNGGTPHGFAIDCRNETQLADVGSGTYRCPRTSPRDAVMEHLRVLNKGFAAEDPDGPDTRIDAAYAYPLTRSN